MASRKWQRVGAVILSIQINKAPLWRKTTTVQASTSQATVTGNRHHMQLYRHPLVEPL